MFPPRFLDGGFLFLFFSFILLGDFIYPQALKPTPIQPKRFVQHKQTTVFETEAWQCHLRPLTFDQLNQFFRELGISEKSLADYPITNLFKRVLAFEIQIENVGADRLVFNPDQILLRSSAGPEGSQLDMAHFWPSIHSPKSKEQEQLARVFSRGTITVLPRKKHSQLVVFSPIGQKFPKRVSFQAHRIYYGVAAHTVECVYEVRYTKL